jgi:hypothetical protein
MRRHATRDACSRRCIFSAGAEQKVLFRAPPPGFFLIDGTRRHLSRAELITMC